MACPRPDSRRQFYGEIWNEWESLNGGADNMIVVDDVRTRIDTRYMLQTDDGALIYIRTRNGRAGTPEMVARHEAGEKQDRDDWKGCLAVILETGHEKYRWLNDHTIVARVEKIDGDICYDAYLIDAYLIDAYSPESWGIGS